MKGKLALNVIFNIAIIAFGLCMTWGFKHDNYLISAFFAAAIAVIVYFKLRLIKEVKELARNKSAK